MVVVFRDLSCYVFVWMFVCFLVFGQAFYNEEVECMGVVLFQRGFCRREYEFIQVFFGYFGCILLVERVGCQGKGRLGCEFQRVGIFVGKVRVESWREKIGNGFFSGVKDYVLVFGKFCSQCLFLWYKVIVARDGVWFFYLGVLVICLRWFKI